MASLLHFPLMCSIPGIPKLCAGHMARLILSVGWSTLSRNFRFRRRLQVRTMQALYIFLRSQPGLSPVFHTDFLNPRDRALKLLPPNYLIPYDRNLNYCLTRLWNAVIAEPGHTESNNLYEILEIRPAGTSKHIKTACRKLEREFHPDQVPVSEIAEHPKG